MFLRRTKPEMERADENLLPGQYLHRRGYTAPKVFCIHIHTAHIHPSIHPSMRNYYMNHYGWMPEHHQLLSFKWSETPVKITQRPTSRVKRVKEIRYYINTAQDTFWIQPKQEEEETECKHAMDIHTHTLVKLACLACLWAAAAAAAAAGWEKSISSFSLREIYLADK